MKTINTNNGPITIYANTVDDSAIQQVIELSNTPIGKDANIVMMPDMHLGTGCCIGTTMKFTDKVIPNIVGVDIGCGVLLAQTDIDFGSKLNVLDKVIRQYIPSGRQSHNISVLPTSFFTGLKCWGSIKPENKELALKSLGTLGGGNHFIEAYENGYIAVHTGSRNIGLCVANYYQNKAFEYCTQKERAEFERGLKETEPKLRGVYVANHKKSKLNKDLCYLEGQDLKDYINDQGLMCDFATKNRRKILDVIVSALGGKIYDCVESVHNYIASDNIIRKGAIAAYANQTCVIPLNMRDGMLLCRGLGNSNWNNSAPHGAGRLYGRDAAKEKFNMTQYRQSMTGIYSTCINPNTLDEAPFAYKDAQEIMDCIKDTVTIVGRLKPIYNFKASE